MRCVYSIVVLGVLFGSCSLAIGAPREDDREIANLEARLQMIAQQADSLLTARQDILTRADALAEQITRLRSRDSLNQDEHRDLEGYLRASQNLQDASRNADQAQIDLAARETRLVDQLILLLQQGIDLALQQIERADSDQEEATGRLQTLLAKKEARETRRALDGLESAEPFPVEINPADSPRQLRTKGDILSDQEEAVRQEIQAINERIAALTDEKRVRQKVADLTSDLELFNEQEELLGRSLAGDDRLSYNGATDEQESGPDATGLQDPNFPGEPIDTRMPGPGNEAGSWFFPGVAEAMNAPAPRSPATIQEWIERLENHRQRMHAHADSLNEKSLWFYQQAENEPE